MNDELRDEQGSGLVADAARRHKRLIAGCTLLALLAGAALALSRPAEYVSNARLLVSPLPGLPYSPDARTLDVALETEAQLVRTQAVAAGASDDLGGRPNASQLQNRVAATLPSNSQIVQLSFSFSDPQIAQRGAQAMAESFLAYRSERSEQYVERQAERVEEQRSALEKSLTDATRRLAGAPARSPDRAVFEQQITLLTDQLSGLEARADQQTRFDTDPGEIVTAATNPRRAGLTSQLGLVGGAGLVGLVLGLLLALLRERRDDRLHEPAAAGVGGPPVLGVLPAPGTDSEPVTLLDPSSESGEDYRRLRTAVLSVTPGRPATVAVLPIGPAAASAHAAINLAIVLARAGNRVALVNGDPRSREVALLLKAKVNTGLSEVLLGGTEVGEALASTRQQNLVLLDGGADPVAAADHYLGRRMQQVLRDLRSTVDFVVVAGPSTGSADGQALASLTDGTVLVADLERTTRDEMAATHADLARLHVTVLGTVVRRAGGEDAMARPTGLRRLAIGRGRAGSSEAVDDSAATLRSQR